MTDIVDWLRAEAELVALDRLAEAADEIERLRYALKDSKDEVEDERSMKAAWVRKADGRADEIERLTRENEALKQKLRELDHEVG